jgi:hypothetical protein
MCELIVFFLQGGDCNVRIAQLDQKSVTQVSCAYELFQYLSAGRGELD